MKKIVGFLIITCLGLSNVYGFFDKAIECSSNDSAIQRMQEYLAKKDLKSFIINNFTELGIEILDDSIEFDIEYRNSWPEGMNIRATFLSKLGSEIHLRSGDSIYDDEGNQYFYGLKPSYRLEEKMIRDLEGRPISRTCLLKIWNSYNRYEFINQSYDDFVIDHGYSYELFTSQHTYSLPL